MAKRAKSESLFEQIFPETVEDKLTDIFTVGMMVPRGNPSDQKCVRGAPICIWGGSGIGKTDQVEQAAARAGLKLESLMPAHHPPEDFGGVPVPDQKDEEGYRLACLLGQVRRLNKLGEGVLFFDEASNAAPATQGAMLKTLFGHCVGDTKMSPRIRMLLAANPPEIAAGGYGFEQPTANRIIHFAAGKPPKDRWREWYRTEGQVSVKPIQSLEPKLLANWADSYSGVKAIMDDFLDTFWEEQAYVQPGPGDPKGGFAWRSPRMWVLAGRCVATIRALNMPEELEALFVAGCVGYGPSQVWQEFSAKSDLPKARDVLNNGWKVDTRRLDRTYTVVTAVSSFVGNLPDTAEKIEYAVKCWKFIDNLIGSDQEDLAMKICEDLVDKFGLGIDNKSKDVAKAAAPVMLKLSRSSVAQYAGEVSG